MRFKIWILIAFIINTVGCNTIKSTKSAVPVFDDKILFHSKFLFTDSSQIAHFECNNFATEALSNYTFFLINKNYVGFLNRSKKPIQNEYNQAVIDTIYTFNNSKNRIQIYRAVHRDFIFIFDVTDPIFSLKGNVRPGMTKELFLRKFQITENIPNKAQIGNKDGTQKFNFYFENNKLKRINSYLYLD